MTSDIKKESPDSRVVCCKLELFKHKLPCSLSFAQAKSKLLRHDRHEEDMVTPNYLIHAVIGYWRTDPINTCVSKLLSGVKVYYFS